MSPARAALALALFGSAAPVEHVEYVRPEGRPRATLTQDAEADVIARYLGALGALRAGEESAREALARAAETLASEHGRPDAVAVAEYYAALPWSDRRAGLALERRFDALRDEVVLAEETHGATPLTVGESLLRIRRDLELLLQDAEPEEDVTPAARTAALLARIDVRRVERHEVESSAEAELLERARLLAIDAVARFTVAGQRTPCLEPTWVLARVALLRGDEHSAEKAFDALEALAITTDRPAWRERALLGQVGLARARGSSFGARLALQRLASFRSPAECWALAREAAVQRLSADEPERALDLLEANPPSDLDDEIELEAAVEEWRALIVAAQLRAGRLDAAAATLARASKRASRAADEVNELAEITLLLDLGQAERALALLDGLRAGPTSSELGQVEALVLRGRALIALGRAAQAIVPLERAFEAARVRDRERNLTALRATSGGGIRDASAVGEWLGLSTVETLARAHVLAGAPLRAAASIEAAHAACSIDEAQQRLCRLAQDTTLGAVTWVVGADRCIAVHVRPDGTATAAVMALGRRDITRAVQRVRDAILETRAAPAVDRSRALRREVAEAVLPASLRADLAAALRSGPDRRAGLTLSLLPHGALDRLPFESLLVRVTTGGEEEDVALGIAAAVTVTLQLRDQDELPPRIDGRRTRWTVFGAPADSGAERLDGARRELRSLEVLRPGLVVHQGPDFDRERLLAALAGKSPVHVATHVARGLKPGPAASTIAPFGLLTSGGEVVSVDEIARRTPRLPLLVLLACGSAEGQSVDGLGARGVAQAALDGGTRAAVVTLWPIEDGAGRTAAVTLHAALLAGATPAEAVRRARAALLRVGAPPSEWAAYRLLGHP